MWQAAQLFAVKGGVALAALSAPDALSVAVVAPVVAVAQLYMGRRGRTLQAFLNVCMSLFLLLRADAWLLLFPAAVFVGTSVQDSAAVPAKWARPWIRTALQVLSVVCTAFTFAPIQNTCTVCKQSLPVYVAASAAAVAGASPAECVASVVLQLLLSSLDTSPLLLGAVLATGALQFRVACDGIQRHLFALGYSSGTPLEVVLILLAVAAATCGVLATPCNMQLLHVMALPLVVLVSAAFVLLSGR